MTKKLTFVAAFALVAAHSAFAYVPPSSFILKSLAAKHAGVKGIKVKSQVTIMEGEKPGSIKFRAVTHFNPMTQTLRAHAFDDHGQKLYSIERRQDSATAADALLFWADGRSIGVALKARGLPIRTEDELLRMKDEDERRASEEQRIARWSSTVAWVIGSSNPKEASGPNLWVEKDSFLPLRMTAGPQPDDSPIDLLFEGQRYYREFPYPRAIIAVKGKEPLFRDDTQEVTLTLEAAEFRGALTPGFTEAGNQSAGPLRALIQKYFEVLR